MTAYEVVLSGCDDSTTLVLQLTPEQVATLQVVESGCAVKGGGCKPTFSVRPISPEGIAKHRAYTTWDGEFACEWCDESWPCQTARIGGAE